MNQILFCNALSGIDRDRIARLLVGDHRVAFTSVVVPRILGHEPSIIIVDEAPLSAASVLDGIWLPDPPKIPDLSELEIKEQEMPEFEPNPHGRVGRAHGGKHRGRRNGGAFGRCKRY